jgi:hypothetical protein
MICECSSYLSVVPSFFFIYIKIADFENTQLHNVSLICMNDLHAQNGETIGNIAFLQPYPIVAVDALLEIGTDVILVALSLDDHLLQTNTPSRHFVYCCLTRNFLVRTCFTNSSRRFQCEIMFENE